MRTKFLLRAERKKGLFSAEGQIGFIHKLFSKEKVKLRIDPKLDMSNEKIWMRKNLRPAIEAKTRVAIFSKMPAEMPAMVHNGDAMGFVELISKKEYGNTEKESLKKARGVALRLSEVALSRATKLIEANQRARVLYVQAGLPKKPSKNLSRGKRIIISNALDGFGHSFASGAYLELFVEDLQGLKF